MADKEHHTYFVLSTLNDELPSLPIFQNYFSFVISTLNPFGKNIFNHSKLTTRLSKVKKYRRCMCFLVEKFYWLFCYYQSILLDVHGFLFLFDIFARFYWLIAKDLIKSLLLTEPDRRPTIREVMNNHWVAQHNNVPNTPLGTNMFFTTKAWDQFRVGLNVINK